MESSDNVKVFVRVRPSNKREEKSTSCIFVRDQSVIMDAKPPKVFTYDYVADENSTQEAIFEQVGKPIADSCITGYHGTIFAYGQTGSGKTFTIQGALTDKGEEIHEIRGLIPRVLEYIFHLMNKRQRENPSVEYFTTCSYLEIYNEQITDLLNPASQAKLQIRDDVKKGIYVENLVEEAVASADQAYRLLKYGATNRHVGKTAMNETSSRSHSVFTIYIQSKETKQGVTAVKYSRLHLIDLAGSERQKSTETTGLRLKEAGNINKSLSVLGNVIRALVEVANGRDQFVHYRDSKLTFLLKDSLGGNSKTSIIATISPSDKCLGETLSTLKFAQRAKLIRNKAVINEESSSSMIQMQAELKRLRSELATTQAELAVAKQHGDESSFDDHHRAEFDKECNLSPNSHSSSGSSPESLHEVEAALYLALDREQVFEEEKQKLFTKIESLQMMIERKEYFLQSTKMILRLREARLERLKNGVEDKDEDSNALKEEIEQLKTQIAHHPDVARFAIENLELRELIEYYETNFDEQIEERSSEIVKLRDFVYELSCTVKKLIEDKHKLMELYTKGGNSPSKSHVQSELQRWKYEQELERLRSELDSVTNEYGTERRKWQQREIQMASELTATQQQLNEAEESFNQTLFSKQLEIDRVTEQNRDTVKLLQGTYENELKNLQEGFEMSETLSKKANLTILTLEKQISQLAEDKDRLEGQVRERDETIRRMKKSINKVTDENRRMSICFAAEDVQAVRDKKLEEDNKVLGRQLGQLQMTCEAQSQQITKQEREASELKQKHQQELEELEAKWMSEKSSVEQLSTQLDEMKEENESLNEEAEYRKNQIEQYQKSQVELENIIEGLKKDVSSSAEEIQSLRNTMERQREMLESSTSNAEKISTLMADNAKLHNDLLKSKEEIDKHQNSLATAHKQIEELQGSIRGLEQDSKAKNDSIDSLKEFVENMRGKLNAKDEEFKTLNCELEDKKAELRDSKEREAQLLQVQERYEKLMVEKDEMQEKYESQHQELLDELKQKHEEVKQIKQQLSDREQELQRSLESAQTDIESLMMKNKQYEEIISELRAENASSLRDAESRRVSEVNALEEQISQLQNEHNNDQLTITQLRTDYATLSNVLVEKKVLSVEYSKQSENLRQLQGEIAQLRGVQEEMVKLKLRCDQLNSELTTSKSKERKLGEMAEQWEQTRERKNKEIAKLKGDIQLMVTNETKMKDQFGQYDTQIRELKEELNKSFHTSQQYLQEIKRVKLTQEQAHEECLILKKKIEQLNDDRLNLTEEKKALESANDKLNKQVTELVGHGNIKQKIHHHTKLKEEYNTIKKQHETLLGETRQKEQIVKQLVAQLNKLKPTDPKAKTYEQAALASIEEEEKLKRSLKTKETEVETLRGELKCILEKVTSLNGEETVTETSKALSILTIVQESMQQKNNSIENLQFQVDLQAKEVNLLRKLKDLNEKPGVQKSSPARVLRDNKENLPQNI
jgi:DNA repair exonuclease SbcCD ATPase subunit